MDEDDDEEEVKAIKSPPKIDSKKSSSTNM
jgi:hypothetical protein